MNLFDLTTCEQVTYPTPLSFFVLKTTNRCNFDCDHCYYRHKADLSYTSRPAYMSDNIVRLFGTSLGEYVRELGITKVGIDFHGGEPLLMGISYFESAIHMIKSSLPENFDIRFSLQTNGSLINPEVIDIASKLNLKISVSLDGHRIAQDRHRRFADGSSSFNTVTEKIKRHLLTDEGKKIYGSMLCVIDIRNRPREVFEALEAYAHSNLDFLFPDGTHDNPPPGITQQTFHEHRGYADWLIDIFDFWFDRGAHQPEIRVFDDILALLIGGESYTEGLGRQFLSLFTIETDGEIRGSDILAVSFEHAARFGDGHFLGEGCFQNLLTSTDFKRHLNLYSPVSLAPECAACYWRDICGGGLLAHRYSAGRGFSNPSIYCGNIKALLAHVRERLETSCTKFTDERKTKNTLRHEMNSQDEFADIQRFCSEWDIPIEFKEDAGIFWFENSDSVKAGFLRHALRGPVFTVTHTHFWQYIEQNVRTLVYLLVHRLNCITCWSCQGHRLTSGGWRPRGVGIICRSQTEYTYLVKIIKNAARKVDEQNVGISAARASTLYGELYTIEIIFLPHAEDPITYFSHLEPVYNAFISSLHGEMPQQPSSWEFLQKSTTEIRLNDLRRTFSDYYPCAVIVNDDRFVVRTLEPFFRSEALAVRHYAQRGNIAIFNNHAWALAFWTRALGNRKDLSISSSFQIIHMDYHSDLMSPRMFYSLPGETFIDFFTKGPVCFDRGETIDRAIYSTAIGPGGYLLPFFYQQKERRIRFDHIYPDPKRDTCEAGPEKEIYIKGPLRYGIEQDGPPILQQFGPTLALRKEPEREGNLTISHLSAEGMEFPPLVGEVIFLDIDLDFFSNKMAGNSDWTTRPGWHPGEEALGRLMDYTHKLIETIASSTVPVIVTIATSNDFCPSEIASASLKQLLADLKAAGLIYQG